MFNVRCSCFTYIQTSQPYVYLYFGVACYTYVGIIKRNPVSLTNKFCYFQASTNSPLSFDLIKSLCSPRTDF